MNMDFQEKGITKIQHNGKGSNGEGHAIVSPIAL
jgi:hypothetical protein